jgi:hypothetical protein
MKGKKNISISGIVLWEIFFWVGSGYKHYKIHFLKFIIFGDKPYRMFQLRNWIPTFVRDKKLTLI